MNGAAADADPANAGGAGDRAGDRSRAQRAFLATHGWARARLTPLAQDASARRYWRLSAGRTGGAGKRRAVLMDAPPPGRVDSFITVTRHLQRLGARVPAIAAADRARGFLLLEDLGDRTFARLLAEGFDEFALYRLAVDALTAIRRHPRATAIDLPEYDLQRALAEANLLLDWYLPSRLQRPVTAPARAEFARIIEELLADLPPLPPTLVLRDFHIDNLMLCGEGDGDGDGDAGYAGDGDGDGDAVGECALLDYQDALIGSPAYDLASLLEDARRDISPALARAMNDRYLAQNPDLDAAALRRHAAFWAAQRHCKVAGIFTRLHLRDGKNAYLRHLPRVLNLLRHRLRDPDLSPLRDWLNAQAGAEFGDPTMPA
ncbi:MAG: phosphotransferase [Gammaproteobacteria bacterium]|nr:phosphotransferase [Gammaproteobacteria bacterium]